MYYGDYSFPRSNTFNSFSAHYKDTIPKKYPEDIECVFKSSDPKKGAIYVSNVEAA